MTYSPRQTHSHPPSSAELVGGSVLHFFAKAQTRQKTPGFRLCLVCSNCLQFLVHFFEAFINLLTSGSFLILWLQ